ncbi:MAG: hypothetical protein RBS27_09885 [Giesbergeria sp.]|jgi:hypothetical protein|nr:hypothetical protein [Giesbergeria sp.]
MRRGVQGLAMSSKPIVTRLCGLGLAQTLFQPAGCAYYATELIAACKSASDPCGVMLRSGDLLATIYLIAYGAYE